MAEEEQEIAVELLLSKTDKKLARIKIYPGTDADASAIVMYLDIRMGRGLEAWQGAVDALAGTVLQPEFVEEMFDTLIQGLQELFDERGIPMPKGET